MKTQGLALLGVLLLLGVVLDTQHGGMLQQALARFNLESHPEQQVLRVGANLWPGYEPLFLARDLGYYQETPVQLLEYLSATQVSRALRNGVIEVAALSLDEVLNLREYDLPLQVILVLDVSHGGDAIIARPAFPDLVALRGHRIGVENSALGAYVLSRALQINGLGREDVTVIPAEINEHETLFQSGEVDAVVTFEPVRGHLLALGGQQVFNSRQIPGEIIDVLVVKAEVAQSHPNELRALLRGWFQALDYLHTHPEAAAKLIAPRLDVLPTQVPLLLEGLQLPNHQQNLALLDGETPTLRDIAQRLNLMMYETGLLRQSVDLGHFLAPQFLQQITNKP
jgi:NitT/TauT family transport system substrate-binding protein